MQPVSFSYGTFSFVSNSKAQYNMAVISLQGFKCDENEGCSYSELICRTARLLREAAPDYYEARQLLSACCRYGLINSFEKAEIIATPTPEMIAWVKKACKKQTKQSITKK